MRPPPFMQMNVQAAPPVHMPPGHMAFGEEEPATKKSKMDAGPEANLVPENVFMLKHKGPVTFQVQVPNIPEKTEWKCNGQKIFLTIPITDPVSAEFKLL